MNLVRTSDGSLASISGPAPHLLDYDDPTIPPPIYGDLFHGIFHASLLGGTRDVLLLHTDDAIYVFNGGGAASAPTDFSFAFDVLIGPGGSGARLEYEMEDSDSGSAPTQFVSTPTGVVIIPQGRGRAFFYDGERVGFLGYAVAPAAPSGVSAFADGGAANYFGYTGSLGSSNTVAFGHDDFGKGQIGTVAPDVTGLTLGMILSADYQAAIQFIDQFGNLSPISERSSTVSLASEAPITEYLEYWMHAIMWANISIGPDGTMGRLLLHTKDMKNSGSADLYTVSGNSVGGILGAWATFPDNLLTRYHYNRSDSFLLGLPIDAIPVPSFQVGTVAMGRLWIGGIWGDEGAVIPSIPGRWGTFERGTEIYPDPSGGQITALYSSGEILLAFTATSTFGIVRSDDGRAWRVIPISATAGCIAPSSLSNAPDGTIFWLGADGFYALRGSGGGGTPERISDTVRDEVGRITWSRARASAGYFDADSNEYRCWVPVDGETYNGLGFVWDIVAKGFRLREHERVSDVCVTRDYRRAAIYVGYAPVAGSPVGGVWFLDRENIAQIDSSEAVIETAWISALDSRQKKSAKHIYLWIMETQPETAITVSVYRDYRMSEGKAHVSNKPTLGDLGDSPAIWGKTTWGQTVAPNTWAKTRPLWKRLDVFVPSCEVWKLRISSTARLRILGFSWDDRPLDSNMRTER